VKNPSLPRCNRAKPRVDSTSARLGWGLRPFLNLRGSSLGDWSRRWSKGESLTTRFSFGL